MGSQVRRALALLLALPGVTHGASWVGMGGPGEGVGAAHCVGDLNGDGRTDRVMLAASDVARVVITDETRIGPVDHELTIPNFTDGDEPVCVIAPLSGDAASAELVVGSGGSVWVWVDLALSEPGAPLRLVSETGCGSAMATGDADGDGDLDLLVGCPDPGSFGVVYRWTRLGDVPHEFRHDEPGTLFGSLVSLDSVRGPGQPADVCIGSPLDYGATPGDLAGRLTCVHLSPDAWQ